MSSRQSARRILVAAIVPIVASVLAHWLDHDWLGEVQNDFLRTWSSDASTVSNAIVVVHLATALAVTAVLLTAWWARNVVVGVGYALGGAWFLLLPTLVYAYAGRHYATPATLPEPIAGFLRDQWPDGVGGGVTGMATTIGGAMLVAGVAILVARSVAALGLRSRELAKA